MGLRASEKLAALGVAHGKPFRTQCRFGCHTVPQVFDELDSFGDAQMEQVGYGDGVHTEG